MERDWRDFKSLHANLPGARDAFEEACAYLFRKTYSGKNVQEVEVKKGDGGIDVYVGYYRFQPIEVFQCKFFLDEFGTAQIQQITKSFITAIESEKYKLKKWTLCIPKVLNQDETEFWSKWKNKMVSKYNLKEDFICLINGNELIRGMKEQKIYNDVFKISEAAKIDQILKVISPADYKDCNLRVEAKNGLPEVEAFFNQKGIQINESLREDISKLFFELGCNAFEYGRARNCFIDINESEIIFQEDGNTFNYLDTIGVKKRAGLTFLDLIVNKYALICEFSFEGKGSNTLNILRLKFKQKIGHTNIGDPCYHFVFGSIYHRTFIESINFDICDKCESITFDLTSAKIVPSSMTFFIEYVERLTKDFNTKIVFRFKPLDLVKDVTQGILEEYYPHLCDKFSVE